uniref:Uncharacterized protein n=1 Tax=Anguilla anguilla TaxID=7936 RepID=A0A0E9QKM8_ANGAN
MFFFAEIYTVTDINLLYQRGTLSHGVQAVRLRQWGFATARQAI